MTVSRDDSRSRRLLRILLFCGILYPLLSFAVEVFAAMRVAGYSYIDQAVSELSAVGAPNRSLLIAVGLVDGLLLIAFGAGVRRAAGGRRGLRVTGLLLIGLALVGYVWTFFPMHPRGTETGLTDTMHLVIAGVTVLLILLAIGFSAAAFGAGFRIYAIATIVVLLTAGAWTTTFTSRVEAGLPTPWMGLIERINVYGYLLWMLVLAVILLREQTHERRAPLAPTRRALAT